MLLAFLVVIVSINGTIMMYATGSKKVTMTPTPVFYSEGKTDDGYQCKFRLSYPTESGAELSDLKVLGVFTLPSRNNLTFETRIPMVAEGIYESRLTFPYAGEWNVQLFAAKGLVTTESALSLDVK